MIGTSYGNSFPTTGLFNYQASNIKKTNNRNTAFGTKEPAKKAARDYSNYVGSDTTMCTINELLKTPGKYAVKNDYLAHAWRFGAEYRYYEAAESTEDNPVLVVRGVDEDRNEFEEKIALKEINLYNTSNLEIGALEIYYHISAMTSQYDGLFLGSQERFDYISGQKQFASACRRCHLTSILESHQKDYDFILDITKNGTAPDSGGEMALIPDGMTVDEKTLEMYTSAARERLISSMTRKCSEELSDMLWKK